jgi:hypothetical protein
MTTYSYVRYTANGAGPYSVPFNYRVQSDVTATVDGVSAPFTWTTSSSITFNSAPTNGAAIEIRRSTSEATRLAQWSSINQLDANNLDTDSLQAFYLAQEAIDEARDTVKTAKIENAAVTTAKIADGAVTSAKIADGTIATVDIADGAVTTAKIADSNVTTAKIADSNVTTAKIADANITSAKLDTGSVTTTKIADSNVTTAKIADGAITSAKIADGTISTADIADDAITSDKIADGAIGTAFLADDSVTAAKIAAGAVGTSEVADNAVTLAKMADVATSTVFYRKSSDTGDPEVQTLATLKTDLGLTGTNSGDQTITLTGDVDGTGTGSFAATIANDAVTNAKLANMAASTIKGRVTGITGDPEDLTAAQATSILNTFTDSLKGLAPSSGGGTSNYLRADGTWAVPPGGGLTDGDKGDIVLSSGGTVWTIDNSAVTTAKIDDDAVTAAKIAASAVGTTEIANDAVTYAKIQNVSATDRILGRSTAGAGDIEEITCTAAGRALLDDANAAAQRVTLGLPSTVYVTAPTQPLNSWTDLRVGSGETYRDNVLTLQNNSVSTGAAGEPSVGSKGNAAIRICEQDTEGGYERTAFGYSSATGPGYYANTSYIELFASNSGVERYPDFGLCVTHVSGMGANITGTGAAKLWKAYEVRGKYGDLVVNKALEASGTRAMTISGLNGNVAIGSSNDSTDTVALFIGNGSTTAFQLPTGFTASAGSELRVSTIPSGSTTETVKTLTTDYTVTIGTPTTVTFTSAPASGTRILINKKRAQLSVAGNLSVGQNYQNSTTVPTDGAIIDGNVGISGNADFASTAPLQKLHVTRGSIYVDRSNGQSANRGWTVTAESNQDNDGFAYTRAGKGATFISYITGGSVIGNDGGDILLKTGITGNDPTTGTTRATVKGTNGQMQLTGSIYVDPTNNNFIDRGALITTQRDITNPTGVVPSFWTSTIGNGDNTTFRGVSGGYFKASDRTGLAAGSRGVLYGLQLSVEPTAAHRNNFPYDDAVGLVVNNEGTKRGTEGIYIGNGASVATDANNTFGQNWDAGLGIDCPATVGIYYTKTYNHGIDTTWGGTGGSGATFNNAFLKVKAGTTIIESKNNAGSAVVPVLKYTTGDKIQIGESSTVFVDPVNHRLGIGTSAPDTGFHLSGNGATATVYSTSGQPKLQLKNVQTTSGGHGSMQFTRWGAGDTSTPNGSDIGEFRWDGLNSAGTPGYARFAGLGCYVYSNSSTGGSTVMLLSVSNGTGNDAQAHTRFEGAGPLWVERGEVRVGGDQGGVSNTITVTNTSNTAANSTGTGTIKFKGTGSRDSSGFIKIYIGTTAYYVPVFNDITT